MGLKYHIYTYTSQLNIAKFIRCQNNKGLLKTWLYNPSPSITIRYGLLSNLNFKTRQPAFIVIMQMQRQEIMTQTSNGWVSKTVNSIK